MKTDAVNSTLKDGSGNACSGISVKLLHITTVSESLSFLVGQVRYMIMHGFEVEALCSQGSYLDTFMRSEGIPVHTIEMPRRITPIRDLFALAGILRFLRKMHPRIVHAHTPKGGLLGTVAAWIARVPVRIYHIHGLPFATATGKKKVLLRWSEKVACLLATQVLCVSHSVRQVVINEHLCPPDKIKVLLAGSINGVDALCRFNLEHLDEDVRNKTRDNLHISRDALVIGYVGRIVYDKGIVELVKAWQVLREEFAFLQLVVVGPFEPQDPVPTDVEKVLHEDERIVLVGLDWNTPPLYAAMDVLALPTYREGFPVVPMEAAAMTLPVVATTVTGCVDAVVNGVTGTLVPPRDAGALADAIRKYLIDPKLRRDHGEAGRERMIKEFRPETVWNAMYDEYNRLSIERQPKNRQL